MSEGTEHRSFSVADLIEAGGGTVGEDELIRVSDDCHGMPFHWEFGDMLPQHEDFVLACSGTTLEDIYKAGDIVVYPSKHNRQVNIGRLKGRYSFGTEKLEDGSVDEYPNMQDVD